MPIRKKLFLPEARYPQKLRKVLCAASGTGDWTAIKNRSDDDRLVWAIGKVAGTDWNLRNVTIPRIQYLAKGGIISYPGTGVPVGLGAIGGERGKEGVIPLTDSQQMEILGESIAKHMNVTLDITNEIDGSVLSRKLQKINNKDTFARNGG